MANAASSGRPLRVLTIGHSYVVRLNRSIAAKIAERDDVHMTVVAPDFVDAELRPIRCEDDPSARYELVRVPVSFSRRNHLLYYRGLKQVLAKRSIDLIHCWEEPYVVSGYQVARVAGQLGIPFFFWSAQNLHKRYPPPFAQFERSTVRRAAGWAAQGKLVHETLLERGYPAHPSAVLPLVIDDDAFFPDRLAGEALREELGLGAPVIGFVGRLNRDKGLEVLMRALEAIEAPWSLLALGSGPYEEELRRWASARGFTDRLRIKLAPHDEVPRYLNAMDVLVAPSQTCPHWREQFGRMLVEAFACQVPVIGSDSGEIPHVIGNAGLVVGERDVAGWTRAIERLLSSPAERQELGRKGLERCRTTFTAAGVAEPFVEFYREVLGSARTRAEGAG